MSNQYPKKASTAGSVKISENVIRSITRIAVMEVEGVERLPEQKCNLFCCSSPVSIRIAGDMAEITVHIILSSGFRLPRVAEQVQCNVKENVQNMTGVIVSKVHVIADGICFAC
ncbi:MAG: Asp23/Gls24 family envelope stress response protein [Oscillospiraceae bacterium]|nr:Asp23/Gls24 family envelope stress response protein [Oscillospiraceae bacterium]